MARSVTSRRCLAIPRTSSFILPQPARRFALDPRVVRADEPLLLHADCLGCAEGFDPLESVSAPFQFLQHLLPDAPFHDQLVRLPLMVEARLRQCCTMVHAEI